MAPVKIILDTDPGIDDVHALMLALGTPPEDLELLMISVTWGNVVVENCLRNTVSVFHVIQKELEWREKQGKPRGFRSLEKCKPLVAVGASQPLDGSAQSADYFHGRDGLLGIHTSHPHLSAAHAWENLFKGPPMESTITTEAREATQLEPAMSPLFTPSRRQAHLEMLDLLSSNPPDTIDIVAVGPLTTVAQAAAADPVTFLRARRLVVMGGAIADAGNMTPLAEFNFFADPLAAARVLALTSPIPASTMPTADHSGLAAYPPASKLGARRLDVVVFPLDVTERHVTARGQYLGATEPLREQGSPLAEWASFLYRTTLANRERLHTEALGVTFHDPLCVWYLLSEAKEPAQWELCAPADMRVEPAGQWTRGACVVDRRDRWKMEESIEDADALPDVIGDEGGWLSQRRGNRVRWSTKTPGGEAFADQLMKAMFGGL